MVEFPRTGKRGRPKKPKIVPVEDLRYAQVIKDREGGRVKEIVRKVIFGDQIEQNQISTSLLERQNLTFRRPATAPLNYNVNDCGFEIRALVS